MTKTKIEWCDYTWNPVKGYCPGLCQYCYAHRMYKRFKWDRRIRLDLKELRSIDGQANAKRQIIFVGSTIDIFHDQVDNDWLHQIVGASFCARQHVYLTLTKCYENQKRFFREKNPPLNWWRGLTITGTEWFDLFSPDMLTGNHPLFLSIEPLLAPIKSGFITQEIKWIIIGGLTPKPVHENSWIRKIVDRADRLSIPVFIKNNARPVVERKDYPREVL